MIESTSAAATTSDWPGLLTAYETAVAEFETVSRALTTALVGRNPPDYNFHALLDAEEKARDAVVISRLRLINRWHRSELIDD